MRRLGVVVIGFAMASLSVPAKGEIIESIAAVINGEVVFESELIQAMKLRLGPGRSIDSLSDEEYERLRFEVFRERAREILLLQECESILKERGYDQRLCEREINQLAEENMAQFRSRFSSEEAMRQAMERSGLTEESLRMECLRLARQKYWVQRVAPQLVRERVPPITQEEVEQFKAGHPDGWKRYERVRARHILLRVPQDATPAVEEGIRERAETLSLRTRAGEDFAELARQYSEHEETRELGGELGEISRDATFPEFEILFEMPIGKPSEPIRTRLGYHIVRVDARVTLADYLRGRKIRQALNDWVEELAGRPQTEILYKGDFVQDLLVDRSPSTAYNP